MTSAKSSIVNGEPICQLFWIWQRQNPVHTLGSPTRPTPSLLRVSKLQLSLEGLRHHLTTMDTRGPPYHASRGLGALLRVPETFVFLAVLGSSLTSGRQSARLETESEVLSQPCRQLSCVTLGKSSDLRGPGFFIGAVTGKSLKHLSKYSALQLSLAPRPFHPILPFL